MLFAKPESLYWLLIVLPLGAAWLSRVLWKRRVSAQLGHQPLIEAMSTKFSPGRELARTLLVLGALVLGIIALAQPQWGLTEREIKRMGVDVVFALDLSNSMLAEDARPNRLQAAAQEMRTVMSRLDGDRVGLVVFTSLSFPQSPLTTDYAAISFFLSRLHPDQIPVSGTSVGAATRESIELLLGRKLNAPEDDAPAMRRAKNQVIVLVTDGEDHESDPLATADLARQHGISLVTVGIGNPDGAPIPTFDQRGRKTGVMRDDTGAPILTRLDESTLQQMAQKAGGLYLHYTGKNSVANGIVNYLNELEKTELDSLLRQRYKDRYMFFLTPALLMLLVAASLGQRRPPAQKPAQKSKESPKTRQALQKSNPTSLLVVLALLIVAPLNTGCEDAFQSTLDDIDHANGLLLSGQFDEALAYYQKAEPLVGNTDEYHYNLGRAYLSTGDFPLAQASLARALATDNDDLKFDVLYNLGLALAGQELWQQAYDTFKQALLLGIHDPELYNSERYQSARTNLELAFRKMFPPCAELEDDLEPNNSLAQASQPDQLTLENRTLCGLNDDWYVIPASIGTSIKVTAKFKALRDVPDPEQVFLPRPDDLQLILFDDRGTEAVSIDQGLPLETPAALDRINRQQSVERRLDTLLVTPDMLQTGQNHLYLKVTAAEGLEFKYDLEIEIIPPCVELDDEFEPNDSAAEAVSLTNGSRPLHICPSNEDWFRVDVQPGDSFFVDLQPGEDIEKKSPPELELEILDESTHTVVARGRLDGPYITAGLQDIPHSGSYLVRIRGVDNAQQGPYNFDLHILEPCPIGEDRYAPNHAAQQPAELDPNATIHRYLRLCENNPDHFLAPIGEDKSLELGLSAVPTAFSADDFTPTAFPTMELDLLSQTPDNTSDNNPIASAVQPEIPATAPQAAAPQDDDLQPAAPPMPLHRVLVQPDIDTEQALVRVTGEPGFYHLVALKPPESQDDSEDSQDEENQDEESEDENEEQENQDEQNEDEESQDDSSSDEESKDESSEDDESTDGDEADQQDPQEAPDPQEPESAAADEQEAQEIDARHVQDILQALEEADDNFQMRKALENMPARLIEKNW